MTPRHHPGEDVLIAYAAGTLTAGPALIVAVHLEGCGTCCALVAALEVAGGVLLEQLPPADMSPLALARAMAAIERPIPKTLPMAPVAAPTPLLPAGLALPAALAGRRIGRWRWLAPGMRWSRVEVAGHPRAKVVLLRGRADALLPAHGHRGSEFTQVLTGAIVDGAVRFGQGDLFVADDAINHHLQVASEQECICVSAIEGGTRMHGLLGRLLQPLVGP